MGPAVAGQTAPPMVSWALHTVVVALVAASALVAPAAAGSGRRCGKILLEFMEFVCEGEFYDPYENTGPKRSLIGQRLFPLVPPGIESTDKAPASGFLRAESASQLLRKRNFQGGIVFECCYKACSIMEAQSYCPS
ncbi:unnamed protein product [Ixodes persulcatus]